MIVQGVKALFMAILLGSAVAEPINDKKVDAPLQEHSAPWLSFERSAESQMGEELDRKNSKNNVSEILEKVEDAKLPLIPIIAFFLAVILFHRLFLSEKTFQGKVIMTKPRDWRTLMTDGLFALKQKRQREGGMKILDSYRLFLSKTYGRSIFSRTPDELAKKSPQKKDALIFTLEKMAYGKEGVSLQERSLVEEEVGSLLKKQSKESNFEV